jgi:hypothetical protein
MSRRALTAAALLAALAGAVAMASPAAADWLVTRAGSRIETRGPWQVKGKLVVFTQLDGSLASLRLSEVDLAASRERRPAASAPRRAEAAPRKRISVTDKDVHHAEPAAATADAAAAPAQDGAAKADGAAAGGKEKAKENESGIAVASWERADVAGHAVVRGRVRNDGKAAATDLSLGIHLFDDAGTRLATTEGTLSATVLMPGQEAVFSADFPEVTTFASVKFEPRSTHLAVEAEPKASPPGR